MSAPHREPLGAPEALVRADRWWLLLVGLALLLATGVVLARELASPWRRAQARARELVQARLGAERAARLPRGFRQVWLPAHGRVDRCVICHVGIEEVADLQGLEHPARSHPRPDLLAKHPIEGFGCTLCHGGQGPATEQDAAHGDAELQDEPLLDAARAQAYGLTAAELMEMRCNTCHRDEKEVAGMPLINRAKVVWAERKCAGCHSVKGVGGSDGPDLTYVGDVPYEQRHFPPDWKGPRTALAWHKAHILEPKRMVPGSSMRQFKLDDRDALALALLVSSWRRTR
jgi:cytochrome c5